METKDLHSEEGSSVGHRDNRGKDSDPDPCRIKRALIAAKARNQPKMQFTNLMHHLSKDLIQEKLNRIPLKSAPGTDGMTVAQAIENSDWLMPPQLEAIHGGRYQAPPVRRVFIPKADGSQRPIGVPQVVDRAIQAAMAEILGEIYEQDFLQNSYGFRPKRGCHHAVATINHLLTWSGMKYALEVDIRDFFGSLSHDWLRKFLGLRIGDPRVMKLIDAWLEAGVMEDGERIEVEQGTPQGGSISPLLANVYLHYVLDVWFERKVKKQLRGRAHLVRYADDFVILFSEQQDIPTVQTLLQVRFAQFGLEIAGNKTHQSDLSGRPREGEQKVRRRITFLGFNIIRARTRGNEGTLIVNRTEGKRLSRSKAAMKEKLLKIRHWCIEDQVEVINSILRGHYNYYGIAGNSGNIRIFLEFTKKHWRRCLSRRSQKGRVDWDRFNKILEAHPLAVPRLKIPYSEMDRYVLL